MRRRGLPLVLATAGAVLLAAPARCGGDPSLAARDGLHFSAAMYALWVRDILPVVTPHVAGPDQGP